MCPADAATPTQATAPSCSLALPDEDATRALAQALRPALRPGDILALEGPIGAGKTAFARALIQDALAAEGRWEDVPSPSFTLVQVYDTAAGEIWHTDLYRLSGPRDCDELGLDDAFGRAIVLVEWPDRLGPELPDRALHLAFSTTATDGARRVDLRGGAGRWAAVLAALPGAL